MILDLSDMPRRNINSLAAPAAVTSAIQQVGANIATDDCSTDGYSRASVAIT